MSEVRQPQLEAEGLVNLRETLKENEGKKIFIMFIGSIVEEGEHVGESWCPDCRDGRQSPRVKHNFCIHLIKATLLFDFRFLCYRRSINLSNLLAHNVQC